MHHPDRQILTREKFAELMHRSTKTISRWADRGIIPVLRPTRQTMLIDVEEALAALRKRGTGGRG